MVILVTISKYFNW